MLRRARRAEIASRPFRRLPGRHQAEGGRPLAQALGADGVVFTGRIELGRVGQRAAAAAPSGRRRVEELAQRDGDRDAQPSLPREAEAHKGQDETGDEPGEEGGEREVEAAVRRAPLVVGGALELDNVGAENGLAGEDKPQASVLRLAAGRVRRKRGQPTDTTVIGRRIKVMDENVFMADESFLVYSAILRISLFWEFWISLWICMTVVVNHYPGLQGSLILDQLGGSAYQRLGPPPHVLEHRYALDQLLDLAPDQHQLTRQGGDVSVGLDAPRQADFGVVQIAEKLLAVKAAHGLEHALVVAEPDAQALATLDDLGDGAQVVADPVRVLHQTAQVDGTHVGGALPSRAPLPSADCFLWAPWGEKAGAGGSDFRPRLT